MTGLSSLDESRWNGFFLCVILTNLACSILLEESSPVLRAETLLVRGSGLTGHEIDGEVLLLEPESETFFGLDEVGASIWGLLETPKSVKQLCLSLMEEYEVDFQTCRDDLTPFLEQLLESGLVKTALEESRDKSD